MDNLALIGKKIGMSREFFKTGQSVPVTVLKMETGRVIDVINKEKLNDNYTIVNSILKATNERPEIKIDWRIYTKDSDNPLIRDLIIEGLSLARTQKEEFASVLNSNNNNIEALFKVLEEFSNN